MTDDRIIDIFEQHGQFVTGKDYALIRTIAEAVAAQRTWVGLTDEHRAMIQRGVDRTTPPFNPDWNTEAVLVEEMQRMAKRIEKLEATLERQTTRIVDLQTHIANLEGEE